MCCVDHALGFMKETRQVQKGCCPINCISTNVMYSNNKQTKQGGAVLIRMIQAWLVKKTMANTDKN